jgi:hypothetical protein
MPRDTQAESQANDSSAAAQSGSAAANDTRPGGGLGVPIDTPDPLDKYKWWIIGAITVVFAIGAGFMLRRPGDAETAEADAPVPAAKGLPGSPGGLLGALKDELFSIETDHVQGRLTDAEYEQQKQALELVLRRALAKKPA